MSEIVSNLGFDAGQAISALQALDGAMARLQQTTANLAKSFASLNGVTAPATASLQKFATTTASASNQASTGLNKLSSSAERLTVSWGLVARIITTQAVVSAFGAIRRGAKEAASEFQSFEKQLSEIRAIDPTKTLDQLSNAAQKLANSTNTSLADTADAMADLSGAGFSDTADQIKIFTAANNLAKLGAGETSQAVSLLITSLRSFGEGSEQAARHARILFSSVDSGRFTIDELSGVFSRAAPSAVALGVSLEELGALFSNLTLNGSNAAQASTQISSLFTAFLKPSEDMERALKALGFSSGQAIIQAKGLAGAIQAVTGVVGNTADGTAKLFRNVNALRPVLTTTQNGFKTFNEHLQKTRDLTEVGFNARLFDRTKTDTELATASINRLNTALVVGLGGGITKTLANFARLTGSAETLGIFLEKAFSVATGHAGEELHNAFINRGLASIKQVEDGLAKTLVTESKVAEEALRIAKSLGVAGTEADKLQTQLNEAFALDKVRAFDKTNEAIIADLRAKLPKSNAFAAALDNLEKLNRAGDLTDEKLRAALAPFQELDRQSQDNGFFGQNLVRNDELKLANAKVNEFFENVINKRNELAKIKDVSGAEETATKLQEATQKFAGDATKAGDALLKAVRPGDQLKQTIQASANETARMNTALANGANRLRDMKAQAEQLKNTLADSVARVASLQQTQQNRQFDLSIVNLDDAQKSFALTQRSAQLASQAADKLNDAAKSGDAEQIKQALSQFQLAETTGQQAQQLAQRVGSREAEARAMKTLKENTDRQISAEQRLQQTVGKQLQQPGIKDALDKSKGSAEQLQSAVQPLDSLLQPAAKTAGQLAIAMERAATASASIKIPQTTAPATAQFGRYFAAGGFAAGGFASRGIDTIPAMLSPGEFVISADSSRKFFSQLQAINAGQTPIFRSDGGGTTIGDITNNITVQGGATGKQTARTIATELQRELRRGTIRKF